VVWLIGLICLSTYKLTGQAAISLIDSFEVEGALITVDRLNQLYLLTENDQLWKTDAKGNPQFQFSDNTLGPIEEIDVTNPFNILVFYKAYQLAKVLDRTLNPNTEFDFSSLNLFNVQSLTNGIDNSVWVYDQQEGKIFQLDANGNILSQSQDLIFLIGQRPDNARLIFAKNELWLMVEGIGLLKFNAFGQYLRTFRWEEKMEQVALWRGQLIFRSGQKWYVLKSLLWEAIPIKFPEVHKATHFSFNNNYLFIQRQRKIWVYKISN
jgi:hypothetical protein